ncbi:MAG: hypothetical protein V2I67_02660 [Thermoanaerobaculales bacterium]|jgi:hypothetical protein|nr:hypothetical protein [Thermoanaerobaculales bacterium]
MHADDTEIEYYRTVEDLFSSLRGVPHTLSPRDFQLLRSWWRDGVPMAAVAAGLNEVFAKNRERDDPDPITSLSYCRHAVKRHAKRHAEMKVGAADAPGGADVPEIDLLPLIDRLNAAADVLETTRPAVARVVRGIAGQVELAGKDLPPGAVDEHLFALESTMLAECLAALTDDERRTIEATVDDVVTGTTASADARSRSARALRDREVRLLLDLPRLEGCG